ncbi:MAG: hypothetical protein EAX96_02900 [Candidatus Lokiarchaeota archaeon]|nr:hypothetical protein [Candidatus Lokiarchaeota archaeon]
MAISVYEIPEMILMITSQVIAALIIILLIKKHNKRKRDGEDNRFEKGLILFFSISITIYSLLIFNSFIFQISPYLNVFILIVTMISLIIMVYTIELCILTKTKFIITIIYVINVIALLLVGFITQTSFYLPPLSLGNLALIFFLPILYFYITGKSVGDLRKNSFLMGFGFLGTLGGGTFRPDVLIYVSPDSFVTYPLIAYNLGPLAMFTGLIILLYAFYSTR